MAFDKELEDLMREQFHHRTKCTHWGLTNLLGMFSRKSRNALTFYLDQICVSYTKEYIQMPRHAKVRSYKIAIKKLKKLEKAIKLIKKAEVEGEKKLKDYEASRPKKFGLF
jgi:hypothetical protein